MPNPEELCQFVKKKLNIECASMVQLCARMVSSKTIERLLKWPIIHVSCSE